MELIKPKFKQGLSKMESHLTDKVNMVSVYEAPSFFEEGFFAYLLLQKVVIDRPEN